MTLPVVAALLSSTVMGAAALRIVTVAIRRARQLGLCDVEMYGKLTRHCGSCSLLPSLLGNLRFDPSRRFLSYG